MSAYPTFLISHRIADITFQTEADVEIPHILQPPFARFQVANTQADVVYQIRELDPKALPLPPLNERQRTLLLRAVGFPQQWLNRPTLNNPEVRKKLELCLEHPELTHIGLRWEQAIISDFFHNELDYFYPPEKKKDFSDLLMNARYRNSLARFLPNFSAVMLHGAGVIRNNAALLFMAPDEGGKSSAIRLADSMPVLSDDQVVLRRRDGIVHAYGTPFAPVSNGPLQSRLGGIFLLEKSSHFAISPVSISEALQFIWKEHIHHWFIMPKNLRVQAFNLITDACRQAKIFRVQFPKHYMDWDAIDKALQGEKTGKIKS
jgi:hypothetical protein